VRVVDKGDATPSLGDASTNVADSSYALVQATFYRVGASASPVRSLRASLDVSGPTFTVNARDSSVAGLPDESMTSMRLARSPTGMLPWTYASSRLDVRVQWLDVRPVAGGVGLARPSALEGEVAGATRGAVRDIGSRP